MLQALDSSSTQKEFFQTAKTLDSITESQLLDMELKLEKNSSSLRTLGDPDGEIKDSSDLQSVETTVESTKNHSFLFFNKFNDSKETLSCR